MGSKKLCKLAKDDYLKENFKDYVELVKAPKHICRKCGRVARDEEYLCRAKSLK